MIRFAVAMYCMVGVVQMAIRDLWPRRILEPARILGHPEVSELNGCGDVMKYVGSNGGSHFSIGLSFATRFSLPMIVYPRDVHGGWSRQGNTLGPREGGGGGGTKWWAG